MTQIYLNNTSGWANIGYFRCIAKNRQNKIHRNSTIYGNPDVSKSNIHRKPRFSFNPDVPKLISRDSTRFLSKCIPAQAGKNKQNTSEFDYLWQSRCIIIQHTSETQFFFKSRCISINFPRCYLLSLVVYSRASQPHFNFPRIYLHPLAAYSRASHPYFNSPRFSCPIYGLGQFFMAFKTSSLRSRARSFILGFAPEDESMVDIILLLIS